MARSRSAPPVWVTEFIAWAQLVERRRRVLVDLRVRPAGRTSVCVVHVMVFAQVNGKAQQRLVNVSREYPGASAAEFATEVLGLMSECEARLDEALAIWNAQAKVFGG